MKIHIKGTNLDLTPSIKEFIDTKIGSLQKIIEKFDLEGGVEAWIEIARTTKHHHKGDVFYAEANLHLPGNSLRAEYTSEDIHTSITHIRDILKEQITGLNRLPKS